MEASTSVVAQRSDRRLKTTTGTLSAGELDRAARLVGRDGVCVLRNVFPTALITRWAAAFADVVRERSARPGGLAPRGQGRFYLTLPWRPPFSNPAVFANRQILGVLERVFGQPYVMVQLAADTPVRGSDYQDVHRDHPPLFAENVVTPLYALAVNIPLCDVGPDNGPLEIARGTHRLSRVDALAKIASGEVPLEPIYMSMGDVLIRTPLALHRGTPNRTDEGRPMVVIGYVMRWLNTPAVELRIPRREHEALPKRLRSLLRCHVVDDVSEVPVETYVEFQY
jgi:hypothetical protein